jgi:hypothetical protein
MTHKLEPAGQIVLFAQESFTANWQGYLWRGSYWAWNKKARLAVCEPGFF